MQIFTYSIIAAETILKVFEIGHLSSHTKKEAYGVIGAATTIVLFDQVQKTHFDSLAIAIAIESIALLVLSYAALSTYIPKSAGKYDAAIINAANSKWGIRIRLLVAAIAILK